MGRGEVRPLPWVATFLYGAVLAAGLLYQLVAPSPQGVGRTAGFAAILAGLLAVEVAERRRFGLLPPPRVAAVLLAVRFLAFVALSTLDPLGFARVLFLLLPFTAYFSLGRRVAYAVAAGCLGLVLVAAARSPGGPGDPEAVSDVLMFAVGLVFALSLAALAADHVAQAGTLATATERNRLARDIHDGLGHHLTAVSVQLEKAAAFRDRDPAAAGQALVDARRSARFALEDVRQSVGTLRADGSFALGRAVADLTRDLGDTRVELAVAGEEGHYSGATLLALYRAAQEGLTNVRKHAAARTVTVALDLGESAARLRVADDGRGFVPAATNGGFGLRGMRERLELVGGSLVVDSAPGRGTELTVCVPR